MADFLLALSDFDRRRGWEALGHASLFSFLVAELHLSNSAAFYRKSAARLLQDFPEVIEPLREGRLCLSTIAELAKVLTEENRAVMVPRFFGLSAREAQELVAELQPRPAPPLRDLMTSVTRVVSPTGPAPSLRLELPSAAGSLLAGSEARRSNTDSQSLLTSEVAPTHPARVAPRPDEFEPLTASLTRLHFNVRREVVKKVEAARRGLGHAIPNATLEQVLEAALDLLLEKQARARGQVKRPRTTLAAATPPMEAALAAATALMESHYPPASPHVEAQGVTSTSQKATPTQAPRESTPLALAPTEPPPARRTGHRETIPASVRRAVWARDRGRCSCRSMAGVAAAPRTGSNSITSSHGPSGARPHSRTFESPAPLTIHWRRGGRSGRRAWSGIDPAEGPDVARRAPGRSSGWPCEWPTTSSSPPTGSS